MSRESGESFQLVLERYAAERFLYRLGESEYRDDFVLKGATLFTLWGGGTYRPTRDMDFTGYGNSIKEHVREALQEICAIPEDDGISFDSEGIRLESIREDAAYNSFRARLKARLAGAKISMQIDIGFGNAIFPSSIDSQYPTILDHPPPRIMVYPREAFVAEKLHAMVVFGNRNSRYKDFYDVYTITSNFAFQGRSLKQAVVRTFDLRGTTISKERPVALTPQFYADADRAAKWRSYIRLNQLEGAPPDFGMVGERLMAFLIDIWHSISQGIQFNAIWSKGGSWRYKPYPAYKESGVEWLGAIPAHWKVKRLKHIATSNDEALPDWTDPTLEISYVDIGSVDEVEGVIQRERVSFGKAPSRARRIVRAGDIIISTVRTYLRAIASIAAPESNQIVSTGFAVIRPRLVDGSFAAYAVRAPYFVENVVANSMGVSYPAISADELVSIAVACPTDIEQQAIVGFLDRETAKIDALVAKKEWLIELFKKKRVALITQAVTKGLDPDVPMTDSGVEWLGEIPAHWALSNLSRVTECLDNLRIPLNAEERGRMQGIYPYWGANSIVDYVDDWLFDEELVLIGEDGAPFFDIDRPVAFRVTGKIWVNNHAHVLRPKEHIVASFLADVLNCVDYRAFIDGTTRDKLTQGDLNAISIQLPPPEEQRAIAALLDRETAKIDALVAKVGEAIERLKELRAVLISAAVTGKIDVRESGTMSGKS